MHPGGRLGPAQPLLLGAALAAALSGCAARPPLVAEATSPQPHVGDCWVSDDQEPPPWPSWRDTASVACREPHTSITYAVTGVDAALHHALTGDHPRRALVHTYLEACRGLAAATHVADVPNLPALPGTLEVLVYLPTRAEWSRGVRWVRCDAATPLQD